MSQSLRIGFVPGRYAVSRLAVNEDVPTWLSGPGFKAVVHSDDETTVICLEERVPGGIEAERGWVCLRTFGPFPFDAAGIIQSLIGPLSDNRIGVFVICTFDGEHVLIPAREADNARRFLKIAGHMVAAD